VTWAARPLDGRTLFLRHRHRSVGRSFRLSRPSVRPSARQNYAARLHSNETRCIRGTAIRRRHDRRRQTVPRCHLKCYLSAVHAFRSVFPLSDHCGASDAGRGGRPPVRDLKCIVTGSAALTCRAIATRKCGR